LGVSSLDLGPFNHFEWPSFFLDSVTIRAATGLPQYFLRRSRKAARQCGAPRSARGVGKP